MKTSILNCNLFYLKKLDTLENLELQDTYCNYKYNKKYTTWLKSIFGTDYVHSVFHKCEKDGFEYLDTSLVKEDRTALKIGTPIIMLTTLDKLIYFENSWIEII